MQLPHLFVRTKEVFSSEGWHGVVLRTLNKLGRMLLVTNDAYWFVRDLSETIEQSAPRVSVEIDFSHTENTIRWLRENNAGFGWLYVPSEVSLARACGHYLPSVRLNGKTIGYIKIARDKAYVLDYQSEICLLPSEAFVYDTFVLREYRGMGIASFLIARTMAFLRQKDYRRLWCHIPRWNSASIAAFQKSGFKRIAHVRFFRILGLRLFSINPERLMRRAVLRSPSDQHHNRATQP